MAMQDFTTQQMDSRPSADPDQQLSSLVGNLNPEERAGFYAAFTGAAPAEGPLVEMKAQIDQLPPEGRQKILDAFRPPDPGDAAQGSGGAQPPAVPTPDGAFAFPGQNGSSYLFTGPAAEQARAMAERGQGARVSEFAVGPNAPPGARAEDVPQARTDAPSGVGTRAPEPAQDEIPEMLRRPEEPTQSTASSAQAPGGVTDLGSGFVEVGGQVYKRQSVAAQKGGVVPQSVTTTRQGGFEPNPEFVQGLQTRAEEQKSNLAKLRDVAFDQAEARAKLIDEELALRNDEEKKARVLAEAQQKEVERAQKDWQDAKQEYVGSKAVDPGRIFHGGGGALRGIAAALAAGAGAFASTMSGSPNFALNIINKAVDDDIQAQREEIALKKDKAQGLLAELERKGLSKQQAELLARSIQKERIALEMQAVTAYGDLAQVYPSFDEAVSQVNAELAKEKEAYDRLSQGQSSQTVAARVQQARAGGSSLVPATLAERKALQDLYKDAGGKPKEDKPDNLAPLERANKLEQITDTAFRVVDNIDSMDLIAPSIDDPASELVVNPLGEFAQQQQDLERDEELLIEGAANAQGLLLTEMNRPMFEKTVRGNGAANTRKRNALLIAEESARRWYNNLGSLSEDERRRRVSSVSPRFRKFVTEVITSDKKNTGQTAAPEEASE